MNNHNISIQDRTRNFANRVIKVYVELNKRKYDDAGKVLSKQFLRSGTSIGANCCEAEFAQSRADFRSKLTIALNYITLNINNKQQQQWLYFFLLSKVTITQILYSFTSIMVYS